MIAEKNPIKRIGLRLFFTGPTFLAFATALLIPFAYGVYLTFMDMNGATSGLGSPVFNGVQNYIDALQDMEFWTAMKGTLWFTLWSVVLSNAIGLGLALLVTSGIKGQNFFRTTLFTPNLIGGLLLGYIWQFFFVTTLPQIGSKLHIPLFEIGWLGDEKLAMWAIIIVSVWQSAGYLMIIFIAGLISVPKDVIEASTIDGASAFQRLTRITMPMMVPSFVITIFLTLKNSLMVYDLNYSLTQGDPYGSTRLVSMHIVGKTFDSSMFGVGQSEAIVLFVIVAIATGIQVYFSKKLEVEA
jgi:raffinose/stachyose/melibiose transport system permease protein